MSPLGLLFRFVRRLPDYYIATRNVYLRAEMGLPINVCIFDNRRYFYTPDNLLVHSLWTHHCTSYFTRDEVREWLKFTDGCRSLLDAGASAGFFSAIFNRTTEGLGTILSVEPDSKSFKLLQETIRLNGGGKNWLSVNCALSNVTGRLNFFSSGFGGDLGGAGSTRETMYRGEEKARCIGAPETVRVETLESLCLGLSFAPDLIKMDIESYEFEALSVALEFLKERRPKLFLELHNEKIRGRNLNPEKLLESLVGIGYQFPGKKSPADVCAPPIVHLCLTPP
jgi:FkbM family methyltransferase